MLTVGPSVERRVDALQEADVLVGDEHVDEAAQLALVVEEALGEAGVLRVERLQHLGDGAASTCTSAAPPERLAQLRGDADGDGHRARQVLLDVERGVERVEPRRDRGGRAARSARPPRASSARGR